MSDMTRKEEVWQIVCVAERLTHEGWLRFYTTRGLRSVRIRSEISRVRSTQCVPAKTVAP